MKREQIIQITSVREVRKKYSKTKKTKKKKKKNPSHVKVALPSMRAAVRSAVFPVKSSPPDVSTMYSPNGSPNRPKRSFWRPGLAVCAQGGE